MLRAVKPLDTLTCANDDQRVGVNIVRRALQAPVDTLVSNWAYMVMTSLAWNLKAWFALWPTETSGRWRERHRRERAAQVVGEVDHPQALERGGHDAAAA